MIRERIVTFLDLIINFIVAFICIYAGLVFNSYAVVSCGYYTLLDMFEDIISFLTVLVRGRRGNKRFIIGYGKKELEIQVLIGVIILAVGLYVLVRDLFLSFEVLDIRLLFVVLGLFVVKILFANYEFRSAKNIQSSMLMNLAHDNFYAGMIFIGVIFFVYMGALIPVFDLLGTLFIAFVIGYKGLNSIVGSALLLYGENKQDKSIISSIKKICEKKKVKYSYVDIIKINGIYKINLEILVDNNIKFYDLILLEREIKSRIKKSNNAIMFVDVDSLKDEGE